MYRRPLSQCLIDVKWQMMSCLSQSDNCRFDIKCNEKSVTIIDLYNSLVSNAFSIDRNIKAFVKEPNDCSFIFCIGSRCSLFRSLLYYFFCFSYLIQHLCNSFLHQYYHYCNANDLIWSKIRSTYDFHIYYYLYISIKQKDFKLQQN